MIRLILIFLVVLSAPSFAQDFDESYRANPKYNFMVREASRHQSDNFRFNLFRSYYKDTSQYDPIAENITGKMWEYAFVIQNEKDEAKVAQALEGYQKLVLEHLANIRVVAQALSLSKLDTRFGNKEFFDWVIRGLIASIRTSGDGGTLQNAYHVITLPEETILLGQLGLKPVETLSRQEGHYHYNMHEAEDIKTGQKKTIFVNTTIPMRFLERQQKQTGKTLAIPRQ